MKRGVPMLGEASREVQGAPRQCEFLLPVDEPSATSATETLCTMVLRGRMEVNGW